MTVARQKKLLARGASILGCKPIPDEPGRNIEDDRTFMGMMSLVICEHDSHVLHFAYLTTYGPAGRKRKAFP
jgi:hypothetical protein